MKCVLFTIKKKYPSHSHLTLFQPNLEKYLLNLRSIAVCLAKLRISPYVTLSAEAFHHFSCINIYKEIGNQNDIDRTLHAFPLHKY